MKTTHKLAFYSAIILLILFATGCDSLNLTGGDEAQLQASGIVEAVDVIVSPEQAGRVAEVYAVEGDQVQSGDPLFVLEDKTLVAHHELALADLESAQANLGTAQAGLELAKASLRVAEVNIEAADAAAEVQLLPVQQALDDLHDNVEVARGEALKVVSVANRAERDAQYQLDNFTVPINHQEFSAMEAVSVMKERLDQAREKFEPYKYKSSSDAVRKKRKEDLEDAQSDFDSAVRRLEYETNLKKAQANQDKAIQDLANLQDGPDPDDVAVLEAQITANKIVPKQAEAAAEGAKVGVIQARSMVEQAEAAVAQAQAALNLLDIQKEQHIVRSAVDGVVLVRNVEPGEVIQPGIAAMIIGQLDKLTVTVYIPEDRYGQINLGDNATVSADSFPDEVFSAVVIRIADQAEYTPRNVQTQEDRRTIVFAIELAVDDPQGKLKPGMPADVEFGE